LFCSANERYELLAAEIRSRYRDQLSAMEVLELDPSSPLQSMLSQARTFTRSFYQEGRVVRKNNGAVCEDITALTFKDACFDLIVSSDVLEHVHRLDDAFHETARVLKPGGAHLFTVPPRALTRQRAKIVNGEIHYIEPPEYHSDPQSSSGILAFWDIGSDLASTLPTPDLHIHIVRGPTSSSGRVVWIAEQVALP